MEQKRNNSDWTKIYKQVTSHGILYPVVFDTAKDCEIIDVEGNHYLDFSSGYGVVNVGWQRKELLDCIRKQAEKCCFSVPWMPNCEAVMLAEKLIDLSPASLSNCIRATGGGEANEVAIKAAYSFNQSSILSFVYSYHGGTSYTLSISDYKRFCLPETHTNQLPEYKISPPYCFRCPYKQEYGKCDFACLTSFENKLKEHKSIQAFIFEPILGSGGVIVPPPEFFVFLNKLQKKYNLLLIADEVMTGFGRTGSFFASDQFSIEPDALTLSKGMSSGYMPIGATLLRSNLATKLLNKYQDVTATYAWTPLATAVALTNINYILDHKLADNASLRGAYLMVQLKALFNRYLPGKVGEIRGKGLMIGLELVEDMVSKKPATMLGKRIILQSRKQGLILVTAWDWHILVFLPPLTITQEELDRGIAILEDVLKLITRKTIT